MPSLEPQATDIIIDGAGYMLTGGKGQGAGAAAYRRSQDGMPEGRTSRIAQRDFFGGQHRAFQLERDAFWDSVNVGPVFGGQGIEPWPFRTTVALTGTTPLLSAARVVPTALVQNYVFYAVEHILYRCQLLSTSTWGTPNTMVTYAPNEIITGLANYNGDLLITFGDQKEIEVRQYPGSSGVTVTTLLAGEKGSHVAAYAGFAAWAERSAGIGRGTHQVRFISGTGVEFRALESPITGLTTAGGYLWATTRTALYRFGGNAREVQVHNPAYTAASTTETDPPTITALKWSGEFDAFHGIGGGTDGDDYKFVISFGGKLVTWAGKRVVQYEPAGDRAGWRDLGLEGKWCYGACVTAGYLIVALDARDARTEVWAWDGSGWWLIDRDLVNATGDYDLMVFRRGTRDITLYRLTWRGNTRVTYPSDAEFITSMIDAAERDKHKAWRKVGCVFATPEKRGVIGSNDPVNLGLEYMLDADGIWQVGTYSTVTGNFNSQANTALELDLASNAAVSRFLQLRVTWGSVQNWAPVLVAVWAEYELLDAPARRRRWSFTVTAEDQVVDRDGSVMAMTGRQLIASLWNHWQHGSTVLFRDVDWDDDQVTRRVRIIGIEELVPVPHQAGRWGQSTVMLTLVEV